MKDLDLTANTHILLVNNLTKHSNFMENSGVFAGIGIFYLAILVVLIVAIWKVFEKAGKPGWAAIIPIYNLIVLLEIVGKPAWWVILMIIPLVNIVVLIIVYDRLAKSFGQGIGFTVGLILLSIVFLPLLGFGNYSYKGAPS